MAYISKENLTGKFENGDLPDGNDFKDLIDSCYNTISGYSGSIQFVDNNSITNLVTISGGLIFSWNQY